jgi:hypothetical protein
VGAQDQAEGAHISQAAPAPAPRPADGPAQQDVAQPVAPSGGAGPVAPKSLPVVEIGAPMPRPVPDSLPVTAPAAVPGIVAAAVPEFVPDGGGQPKVTPGATSKAPGTVLTALPAPLATALVPDAGANAEAVRPDAAPMPAPGTPETPPGAPPQGAPFGPDQTRYVIRQIAESPGLGAALSGQAGGIVELALSPQELGSVRIVLGTADGALTMQIAAERPETADLLRRNADLLLRDLHDAGIGNVSLHFGGGQDTPHPSDRPAERAAQAAQAPDQAAPPVYVAAPPARPADGRLDLRL